MQINTGSNPNPMFSAKSGAMRSLPQAVASAQRLADQTAGGAQPQQPAITQRSTQTVDANFIMQHWGSSNALADLNVDGIVDAQDLAMALHNASEGGAAGDNDSAAEWNSLTGGDLNGDGMVDAQDLAIRLNNDQNNAGGDGGTAGDGDDDSASEWNALTGGDLNGDGMVDAQDLAIRLNNDQNNAGGDGGTAGDGDSASEWNALTGGDLNGDGMVDAQDLAIRLNNDQNNAGGDGGTAGDGDGATDGVGGAVAGQSAPETTASPAIVERLTNLILKSLDGDGDGVLTETDFPENTKVFARFDADGNGLLERAELERGLSDEFGRFSKQFTSADPEAFAKRWLEAFTGTLPMPSYTMNRSALADFFRPPHQSAALNALPGFLSAQA
jgi:Ca2+-binding EF-hand superfamily protein